MPIKTGVTRNELDALNKICSYVGLPPLLDILDVPNDPDFALAQLVLDEVRESILAASLPCNTDVGFTVTGGTVPDGALVCDPIDIRYTIRDGKIYDATEFTDVTEDTECDIAWNLTFDGLPLVVKNYITVVAARSMVGRVKGDQALLQLTIPDEARVRTAFAQYNQRLGDYSMLSNPHISGILYMRYRGQYLGDHQTGQL